MTNKDVRVVGGDDSIFEKYRQVLEQDLRNPLPPIQYNQNINIPKELNRKYYVRPMMDCPTELEDLKIHYNAILEALRLLKKPPPSDLGTAIDNILFIRVVGQDVSIQDLINARIRVETFTKVHN